MPQAPSGERAVRPYDRVTHAGCTTLARAAAATVSPAA